MMMDFKKATTNEIREWVRQLEMPEDFNSRIIDSYRDAHHIYRKAGSFMARCSKCDAVQIVDRKEHKHGDKIICDKCKTEANVYDVRSNTNYYYHGESLMVTLLQKSGNIFVFSRFIASCDIVDQREQYRIQEVECRVLVDQDIISFSKDWQGEWTKKKLIMQTDSSWGRLRELDFCPDSFDECLSDTDLRHSCLGKWLDKQGYYLLEYFAMARKYPFVELLYKGGMINLYREFITDRSGKVATIGLLKRQRGFVKRHDLNMSECQMIRKFEINGLPISDLSVKIVRDRRAETILAAKKIIGNCVSIKQIAKYLDKQGQQNMWYIDYLSLMEKIETPVDNLTAFPRDLKKAHDDAITKFNAIKHEIESKTYDQRLEEYSKLAFEIGGLAVVVPLTLQDILREGKEMNNCVGSYVDRVEKGQTIILFIRKVDEIDTSYYTMEYRDSRIVQCRGYRNAGMPPEVEKFTEEWLKLVKKPKKKVKVQQDDQRANA